LANTLIMSVPTRVQPGSRPGSHLRTTWARQRRASVLPARGGRWDQRVSDTRTRRTGPTSKDRCPCRSAAGCQPTAALLPCCLCTNMWMTCAQRRQACA